MALLGSGRGGPVLLQDGLLHQARGLAFVTQVGAEGADLFGGLVVQDAVDLLADRLDGLAGDQDGFAQAALLIGLLGVLHLLHQIRFGILPTVGHLQVSDLLLQIRYFCLGLVGCLTCLLFRCGQRLSLVQLGHQIRFGSIPFGFSLHLVGGLAALATFFQSARGAAL